MKKGSAAERSGLPKEMVSCPACGETYGAHHRKVCSVCAECSRCCLCLDPKPPRIRAAEMIRRILTRDAR